MDHLFQPKMMFLPIKRTIRARTIRVVLYSLSPSQGISQIERCDVLRVAPDTLDIECQAHPKELETKLRQVKRLYNICFS